MTPPKNIEVPPVEKFEEDDEAVKAGKEGVDIPDSAVSKGVFKLGESLSAGPANAADVALAAKLAGEKAAQDARALAEKESQQDDQARLAHLDAQLTAPEGQAGVDVAVVDGGKNAPMGQPDTARVAQKEQGDKAKDLAVAIEGVSEKGDESSAAV